MCIRDSTKYDQFDFLIDIVPREEAKIGVSKGSTDGNRSSVNSDQVTIIMLVLIQEWKQIIYTEKDRNFIVYNYDQEFSLVKLFFVCRYIIIFNWPNNKETKPIVIRLLVLQ